MSGMRRLTLKNMMSDLKDMKLELLPTKDAEGNEIDPNDPKFDDYQRKVMTLTKLLEQLRPELDREQKMRQISDADAADHTLRVDLLHLQHENSSELRKAGEHWKDAQQMVVLAAQRGKLDKAELSNRKDQLRILSEELKELSQKNSSINSAKTAEEKAFDAKRAARQQARTAETAKRERRRRPGQAFEPDDPDAGGGGGGGATGTGEGDEKGGSGSGGGGGGSDIQMSGPASGEDGQFQAEVLANRQDQDKMLEQILQGVNELGDLAGALKTEIDIQGAAADELDTKIGKTTNVLKTQTAKLQELLDESGGPCRWVPILICIILLIALIGYLWHMVRS